MAFNNAEKVQIRRWVGGDMFYVYSRQRLESAITTVETGLDDGGETENYIRDVLLVRLAAVFAELTALENKLMALDADEVKVDPVRATDAICRIGRIYSTQLAHALGFSAVLRDPWAFATPDLMQELGDRA